MPYPSRLPRVTRVSWREWLGVGAAVLAVVSAFLDWTVLSSTAPAEADQLATLPHGETHRDAFDSGVYAWISVSLTVVTGVTVAALGQFRSIRRAGLPQLWLVAALVGVALAVIGFFALGVQFGSQGAALLETLGVRFGVGTGRWLGLGAAVLTLVASVFDLVVFRREPSGRSSGSRRRSSGR